MKKLNKKGFTMAELLIVIAIIAILIAIAFPVFGAQLNKARHAVDVANIRSLYSEAAGNALMDENYVTVGSASKLLVNLDIGGNKGPNKLVSEKCEVAYDSSANSITIKSFGGETTITIDPDVVLQKNGGVSGEGTVTAPSVTPGA